MAGVRFLRELRRRHVFRVAAGYAVVGWLLIQISTQVFPFFDLPNWSVRLIVLVILAGFPIALVLAWAFDSTPAGVVRTDGGQSPRSRRAGIAVGAVGVLIAAVAGFAYWHWYRSVPSVPPVAAPRASDAAATRQVSIPAPGLRANDKSIAVLPFANLSDEKANAYFADGMQDEILTRLSKIGALRIVSRTSTSRYASAPDNLPEIARQLAVANILEGSVQKAGNAVHINVQLIRAATDEHLWAESYNRTLEDVFGVEGEVAQAVADALKATLTGAERQAVIAKGTENPAAYEAYLRGRATDNSGYTFIGTQKAVGNYLLAVRADPNFAQAWAAVAVAMANLYFNGYDTQRSTETAVRDAADTAMKLQPDLAESLWARGGYYYWVKRDYRSALELFKRALAKQPGDVDMLASLFFIERRLGLWDDAIAHYRESLERDPRNVGVMVQGACEIFFWLRRYDETRELLQQALKIAPGDTTARACLAQVEQRLGRLDAADGWLAGVPKDLGDFYEGMAQIDQLTYRRDEAGLAALAADAQRREDIKLTNVDYIGLIRLGFVQSSSGHAQAAAKTFQRLASAIASRPGGIEHVTAVAPVAPLVYAGLGDFARAVAAAQHQIELDRDDTLDAAAAKTSLAKVHAMAGHREAAIALLPELLEIPGGITPALLSLDPLWDPIRDDPRFVALTKQPPAEYKAPPHG